MGNQKQNDCVGHINADWHKADRYITYAHKVTARAYWAILIFIIAIACNIIGLFNHHVSTRSYLSRHETSIEDWCKFMVNDSLHFNSCLDSLKKKGKFEFNYEEQSDRTDTIEFKKGILSFRDSALAFKQINFNKFIIKEVDFDSTKCTICVEKRKAHHYKSDPINPRLTTDSQNEEFKNQSIKSWYINIPLLGIPVSVEDFLIVMNFTFLLLSWFFKHTIKAENFTIGKILTIFYKKPTELKELIFYGITFNNLFFPTTQRKRPYWELHKKQKSLTNIVKYMPDKNSPKSSIHLNLIFYVPTGICFANLICYILGVWYYPDAKVYWVYFLLIGFCGVIFTSLVAIENKFTCRYLKGTKKILYQFKQSFKHDRDIIRSIKRYDLATEAKKIVIVLVNSEVIYNNKKYGDYKDEFCKKYCRTYSNNNYFLLTHTENNREVGRIVKFIKDNPKKVFGNDYLQPTNKPLIERFRKEVYFKKENREYFIFFELEQL